MEEQFLYDDTNEVLISKSDNISINPITNQL